MLEKHLQLLSIGTDKDLLPFWSLLPVTQAHGWLGKRSGVGWGVVCAGTGFVASVLRGFGWGVLLTPPPPALLSGCPVLCSRPPVPRASPCSSSRSVARRLRGRGAPSSAGCGGGARPPVPAHPGGELLGTALPPPRAAIAATGERK